MSTSPLSHDAPAAETLPDAALPSARAPRSSGGREPLPPGRSLLWRRVALAAPALATAVLVAALALQAYGAPGTGLGWGVLILFCLVMAWQAFTAWQYLYGLVAAALGERAKSALERRAQGVPARATGLSRTAAVVPIHAEDAGAVFAALRVMARSLQREGGDGTDIDIFILSDTRDGAIIAAEERALAEIRTWAKASGPGLPRIRYRRRQDNAGRKAGNIAEFCATYGPEYDLMIVLDADSLMSGASMRRLVRLMEENPEVGLIQTVSYAAGHDTLFARAQQFAVRLYAPLALRCLETWQGPDGSYWGHNAILRVAAFAASAELPVLPGRPPLGGEILCHDVVEGALMRRAGWEVRLLPEMGGTWEEMPTNLIDLLGRERRWCQGNLQHLRVVPMPGLPAASRWHLVVGILSYAVLPLWAAFLGLGTLQALWTGDLGLLAYGLTGSTPAAHALAILCLTVLALPKLLSLGHVLAARERRAAFGGTVPLLKSAALEQVLWILLWPVMTLFGAGAVAATLVGRVVRWDSQPRADRKVGWSEALRLQSDAVVAGGLLAGLLAYSGDPLLALWMAPVALGLLSSPAQSVLTSSPGLGRWFRRRGLFLTVDDTAPAPELAALHQDRLPGGLCASAQICPDLHTRADARQARESEPAAVWLAASADEAR